MADQDKDRMNQGSLTGGTQTGTGVGMQDSTPSQPSRGASSSAGNVTGSSGGTGAGMSGKPSATGSIKESGSKIANEARKYAGDMTNRAKEKGRTMFDQQKETAVGQVHSVAHAFRNTAGNLQGEGQNQVARYIEMAADQLESLGGRLREKDLDTLVADAQNMVRRSPGTFFAGSVAAGFLLARFLKSSSEQAYRSTELSRGDMVASDEAGADRYASAGGEYAAPGAGMPLTAGERSTTELGADGTPSTAQGTSTTAPSTSPLTGSTPGGNSYGNR
ncbi:MAG TPA: hypothetical protein VGE12_11000 [Noviherbaspirillum sp.]